MSFICSATWVTDPASRAQVIRALDHLARASRAEPGNLAYIAYASDEDPDTIHIFENYVDEAAFDAHVASDHFRRWALEEAVPLLLGRERAFFSSIAAG